MMMMNVVHVGIVVLLILLLMRLMRESGWCLNNKWHRG